MFPLISRGYLQDSKFIEALFSNYYEYTSHFKTMDNRVHFCKLMTCLAQKDSGDFLKKPGVTSAIESKLEEILDRANRGEASLIVKMQRAAI